MLSIMVFFNGRMASCVIIIIIKCIYKAQLYGSLTDSHCPQLAYD